MGESLDPSIRLARQIFRRNGSQRSNKQTNLPTSGPYSERNVLKVFGHFEIFAKVNRKRGARIEHVSQNIRPIVDEDVELMQGTNARLKRGRRRIAIFRLEEDSLKLEASEGGAIGKNLVSSLRTKVDVFGAKRGEKTVMLKPRQGAFSCLTHQSKIRKSIE